MALGHKPLVLLWTSLAAATALWLGPLGNQPEARPTFPLAEPAKVSRLFTAVNEEHRKVTDLHISCNQPVSVNQILIFPPGSNEDQAAAYDWKASSGASSEPVVAAETDARGTQIGKSLESDKNEKGEAVPEGQEGRIAVLLEWDQDQNNPLDCTYKWSWQDGGEEQGEERKLSSIERPGPTRVASLSPASGKTETSHGLHTVTFDTVFGHVTAYLPDDVRAGDTILGTVRAEPKGQSPEERAQNMAVLTGCVIEVEPPKKPDGTSNPKVTAQVTAAPSPFTFTLPPSSTPTPTLTNVSSGSSGGLGITLTNVSGSFTIRGTTTVPIEIVSLSLQSVAPLNITYQLPTIGQQGRPVVISGPFQVNGGTTLMYGPPGASVQDFEKNTENVSGGFGLINPIAKSPRKCVFEAPTNVTGPIELYLKEGNTQTTGEYRNVRVDLTAKDTSLLKGQSTDLHCQVKGLKGIKQPVPLTLAFTGVITAEGGPYQHLVIQPSEVGPDGSYTTTRGITGVQAGVWGATATVMIHRFDVCLQDDSNPRTVVLVNSFTGNYLFPLSGGTSLSGTGTVTRKGCIITLTDSAPDRRVQGNIDPCTKTGSASVQTVSPKVKFTITDRNTTDNTCTCGPGCK